ncbi:MAG TPA: hypothetical protein VE548_02060 [Nitrososphaeraceae archaeon]|nr:hypothetical protein [Nitrososphaeraceae archaeon]
MSYFEFFEILNTQKLWLRETKHIDKEATGNDIVIHALTTIFRYAVARQVNTYTITFSGSNQLVHRKTMLEKLYQRTCLE